MTNLPPQPLAFRFGPIPNVPTQALDPLKRVLVAAESDTSKPKAKRKRKTISFLGEEDIEQLFSVIPSIRDRAIFRLAYHVGLRASENGMLDLCDYDSKADRILIHRLKGSHSGHHHLMREEVRVLLARLKVRGSFPGPIFRSRLRRPIDRTTLHVLMKKYSAAAGIPPELRHFHVLKHSYATNLLSKGFGVERVQDWIGHANIQSTMEYAKVTNARRADMAQQLKDSWQ